MEVYFRNTHSGTPFTNPTCVYNPHFANTLKKILTRYDIETSFRTAPTLKNLLCDTSSISDPKITPNCIYKLSCFDCHEFYIGQTYRPISLRIKKHKASYRPNNIYDSVTGNIKSENQQLINFNCVEILTTTSSRQCDNLLDYSGTDRLSARWCCGKGFHRIHYQACEMKDWIQGKGL